MLWRAERSPGKFSSGCVFPTQLREEVCQLVRWHDEDIPQTDEAVRRWLNLLGPVQLRRLLLLQQADSRAKSPRSDTLFAGRLLQRMENILQRGGLLYLEGVGRPWKMT